ncbi:hypothetical protein SFR_0972 [Streptomyces sp. FR-008]|nr:hypothetical protein SFR_0972 [Streptomyces sp. FR-008]
MRSSSAGRGGGARRGGAGAAGRGSAPGAEGAVAELADLDHRGVVGAAADGVVDHDAARGRLGGGDLVEEGAQFGGGPGVGAQQAAQAQLPLLLDVGAVLLVAVPVGLGELVAGGGQLTGDLVLVAAPGEEAGDPAPRGRPGVGDHQPDQGTGSAGGERGEFGVQVLLPLRHFGRGRRPVRARPPARGPR